MFHISCNYQTKENTERSVCKCKEVFEFGKRKNRVDEKIFSTLPKVLLTTEKKTKYGDIYI